MTLKQITGVVVVLLFVIPASAKVTRIKFDLKYEFAKGGEVLLTISDTIYKNKPAICYHLIGHTTGLTDAIYKVHDEYETIVDATTLLPLKSIRNIKEGKYRSFNETWFYHDIDSIYSRKTNWMKVPDNLTDILSVFFYYTHFYLQNKTVHDSPVTLPCYHAAKISNLTIKNVGDRAIKTDLGQINAIGLAPVVEKGKLLKKSDGLFFYISKEKKIPVLLEFDTKFGDLKAILKSYKIDGVEQVAK